MRVGLLQRRLTVVIAAAVVGSVVLMAPATAQTGAGEQQVLFVREGEPVLADADGGNARPLFDEGRDALVVQEYVWSPDGSWLAFAADEYEEDGTPLGSSLRVVAADGAGERVLVRRDSVADGDNVLGVSWSPDGRRLLYSARGDGLFTVAFDGSDERRVTDVRELGSGPEFFVDSDAAWSPDGSRIAFLRTDESVGIPEPSVHLVDPDGGDLILVTGADSRSERPAWHPSGDRIVFSTVATPITSGSEHTVQVATADGADVQTLPIAGDVHEPAYSPDGTTLAFNLGEALHLAAQDGTDVRQVLPREGSTLGGPISWSPDGNLLGSARSTCCEPRGPNAGSDISEAFTVGVDGTEPVLLAPGAVSYGVTFRPVPGPIPSATRRLAGDSRTQTAAALARDAYPESATAVVLARADQYADALAGGPLAATLDAPLLLTGGAALDDVVAAEIERLAPATVVLLGGETALSAQVATDVAGLGVATVDRMAGSDRFATAAAIAARVGPGEPFLVQGADADPGRGWPDAVAVSALAAAQRRPILLTGTDDLPPATADALAALQPETVTVVGGTAAVSLAVSDEVEASGPAVARLAGATRYETSRAVAEAVLAGGTGGTGPVWLATGGSFPDALVAGPAAAVDGALLLLVDPSDLDGSAPTRDVLAELAPAAPGITLVGGTAAISDDVRSQVEALAG